MKKNFKFLFYGLACIISSVSCFLLIPGISSIEFYMLLIVFCSGFFILGMFFTKKKRYYEFKQIKEGFSIEAIIEFKDNTGASGQMILFVPNFGSCWVTVIPTSSNSWKGKPEVGKYYLIHDSKMVEI